MAAAGAAALVVPELFVPKRTFFLPPKGGWPNGTIYDIPNGTIWCHPDYEIAIDANIVRLVKLKMVELKRDIEYAILQNLNVH